MTQTPPDSYVLPPDVELTPVREYREDIRSRIDANEGDYVLTRPNLRGGSRLVDRETARLLEFFRSPRSIPGAVLEYATEHGSDPEEVLAGAYEVLQRLVRDRMLVPDDSSVSGEITADLGSDDRLGQFRISDVVQVLEDTELYRAEAPDGTEAAVKVADAGNSRVSRLLRREVRALRRLESVRHAPDLLAYATESDRQYLATSWCPGLTSSRAAARLREGLLTVLLQVCVNVLDAYAALEEYGVLHGDVHPENIIIDPSGAAVVLDYGYARVLRSDQERQPPNRGGVYAFYEPEFAAALSRNESPPPIKPAGQQYSVAALLYRLLTGHNYVDFPLDSESLHETILEQKPVPLSERGLTAVEGLEPVLFQALSKNPGDRYDSISEFRDAFRSAAKRPPASARTDSDQAAIRNTYEKFRMALGMNSDRVDSGLADPPSRP